MMPAETTLQRVMAEMHGTDNVELTRANHVLDPQIAQIGMALIAECQSGFTSGRLFGESLALALSSRLVGQFGTRDLKFRTHDSRGLPLWRLRQVTQYIEENLGSDIRMSDLSKVAQMSEFHFSRMFKQSTGVSPHHFIVAHRVNRGRNLLAKGTLPLHEISANLGFGDQSHFTTVFKKNTGMTPKQFRDRSRQ